MQTSSQEGRIRHEQELFPLLHRRRRRLIHASPHVLDETLLVTELLRAVGTAELQAQMRPDVLLQVELRDELPRTLVAPQHDPVPLAVDAGLMDAEGLLGAERLLAELALGSRLGANRMLSLPVTSASLRNTLYCNVKTRMAI